MKFLTWHSFYSIFLPLKFYQRHNWVDFFPDTKLSDVNLKNEQYVNKIEINFFSPIFTSSHLFFLSKRYISRWNCDVQRPTASYQWHKQWKCLRIILLLSRPQKCFEMWQEAHKTQVRWSKQVKFAGNDETSRIWPRKSR